jgi:uncharacterized protein (DUF433 family)
LVAQSQVLELKGSSERKIEDRVVRSVVIEMIIGENYERNINITPIRSDISRFSMASVIVKNPKILGGTPVFRGTRVPLQLLFDSLERGHTLEEFLAGYPTVSRELAIAALEEAQQLLSAKA